jgi:predicted phage terminase large subunit-like protein
MMMNNKGNNEYEIIGCSHTADLAETFSKKIQKIIADNSEILGYDLASEAAGAWETTNNCSYKSAGVNGAVMGRRGDLGIVDDPTKSRKDAESVTYRMRTYDWYKADFLTRMKPNAPIIVISTRWHEQDLAGQLLEDESSDWDVLSLPAIAGVPNAAGEWVAGAEPDPLGRKPGELLWGDDAYGYAEDIRKKMTNAQPRDYWSIYQQSPRALTGGIFKTNLITTIDTLPAGRFQWCRAWDLGGTSAQPGRDPDATAGLLMAKDRENRIYICDIQHFKSDPEEVETTIRATASRDGVMVPISLPIDPGQAGKAQVLWLTRKLVGHKVHSSPETGDKGTRAGPFASQVNVGNVVLIRGEWNKAFIDEMQTFPNGKHDDMVDAASRAFNYLIGTNAIERFQALAS